MDLCEEKTGSSSPGGPDQDHEPPTQVSDPAGSAEPSRIGKSFAEVLHSLRTINDMFHLSVESGPQAGAHISLEDGREEIPIGFDKKGYISADANDIANCCAILRTHWAGVDLTPVKGIAVSVNEERLKTTRLLRHGDRVGFKLKAKGAHVVMLFHEPMSLRILPLLLSEKQLGSQRQVESARDALQTTEDQVDQSIKRNGAVPARYLGLFSISDIAIIAVCTAMGATLVFIALNWVSVS